MLKVNNRACILRLGLKSMKAARARNLIAVLAIALTAVLFTSLFTIAMSINDAVQQNNFRQVGGFSHGGFKYLTQEQYGELKDDPMIVQGGLRRFIGMPSQIPFNKSHVEVGYSDANQAHWMYCDPVEGRLPQEGTDEAATDTRVLELLGVEPELGARFTLDFQVDGRPTTQTFTLCGWWEYDPAIAANHVLIPESRVDAILGETGVDPAHTRDGMTGSWNLDVMLGSTLHIAEDLSAILERHGYQNESRSAEGDFIRTGVNWGYTGAQFSDGLDAATVLAIAAVLILIIFTGYLIIYNIFQISVAGDIRFYGLLKTIGTTGRQIKRIIRRQALILSLAGIPLGLIIGWLVGGKLAPVILNRLDGVVVDTVSVSPVIFVGAALFSLVTVLLSCRKPGRMAARVSPVEAVRYTERDAGRPGTRRRRGGAGVGRMALANLGRSRLRTVLVVVSLSLAVVLMQLTYTVANGFDMEKYVSGFVATDFVVADAGYFQVGGDNFHGEMALPEEVIQAVNAQGGVAGGGRVYGRTSPVEEFVEEEYYRSIWERWYEPEQLDALIGYAEHTADGRMADRVQLYGMEDFALDQLDVLEGDLSKLREPGGRYVAAVYAQDDYGVPEFDSHWARLGDTVTLRYVEQYEYFDPNTGTVYPEGTDLTELPWKSRAVVYRDVEYEVAALVAVPSALSYRYYGADEFILNDQTFIQDTGTDAVMLYAFDMEEGADAGMESFLSEYTQEENPQFGYESRATYQEEFQGVRSMFLMLGGALSFIVGLVGVLNFFNAVLTSILTRRREFAVLQAVGMTGKQLRQMLVWEGVCYAAASIAVSLALSLALGPVLRSAMDSMFWFFTYRFSLLPVLWITPVFLALGVVLPLITCRFAMSKSIVERIRAEG